ncbi:hypothetical protein DVH24_032129 [Malus domestica]|uniref:BTB domain-containing protein n=1 Tax=Malus domestica TaxID=3750 RepID=A0A498J7D7_MALDO|nr:hypothetical protein DVH24_032129 [Malus domestica]
MPTWMHGLADACIRAFAKSESYPPTVSQPFFSRSGSPFGTSDATALGGSAPAPHNFSVEGRLVHTHRCILAAWSLFFWKFFCGPEPPSGLDLSALVTMVCFPINLPSQTTATGSRELHCSGSNSRKSERERPRLLGISGSNSTGKTKNLQNLRNPTSRPPETFRPVDTHHAMEVRLGLSKGPVAPSFM